ncbi:hypothetical protein [Pseudomonas sp. Irchel 3E13]|uniref:hypothetical protein n=1 Tax=Pseudomonas sp. Irchel 3E13 TaxID=2008975 RepID=UPI000BA4A1AC|nr:hypothetical protein [Pseudomonas sp. Irchel 3E13]
MKSKVMLTGAVLAGCALAVVGVLSVASTFKAATVSEIQAAMAGSDCAAKLLMQANRGAIEIRRRDLVGLKKRCQPIDQQAKAF